MGYEILDELADILDATAEDNKKIQRILYKLTMLLAKQEIMIQKEIDRCDELKCRYQELKPKVERSPEVQEFLDRVEYTIMYPKKRR